MIVIFSTEFSQLKTNKLYVKFSEIREVNKQHMKRLNDFEIERRKLIEKIKCLEDELNETHSHLKKISSDKRVQMLSKQKCSFGESGLGFDKFAASSHAASISRTVFLKPELSEPHVACLDKGKNIMGREHAKIESDIPVKKQSKSRSLHTCHHFSIIGHIRPHCPQIHFQRSWTKKHDPKKGKSGTKPSMAHHAPRKMRQPSQRSIPSCHHCGKIGHTNLVALS
jgi:hypothetical protein